MTGLATFIQEKIPVLSNRSCMLHTEVFDHDYLTTDGTEHTDCPARKQELPTYAIYGSRNKQIVLFMEIDYEKFAVLWK